MKISCYLVTFLLVEMRIIPSRKPPFKWAYLIGLKVEYPAKTDSIQKYKFKWRSVDSFCLCPSVFRMLCSSCGTSIFRSLGVHSLALLMGHYHLKALCFTAVMLSCLARIKGKRDKRELILLRRMNWNYVRTSVMRNTMKVRQSHP